MGFLVSPSKSDCLGGRGLASSPLCRECRSPADARPQARGGLLLLLQGSSAPLISRGTETSRCLPRPPSGTLGRKAGKTESTLRHLLSTPVPAGLSEHPGEKGLPTTRLSLGVAHTSAGCFIPLVSRTSVHSQIPKSFSAQHSCLPPLLQQQNTSHSLRPPRQPLRFS